MDRNEHLRFCKACDHGDLDFHRGLLCKLTNEFADFQTECPDFKGDLTLIQVPEQKNIKEKKSYKILEFLSLLLPGKKFLITPVISIICILLFALMVFSGVSFFQPDIESLISWGANVKTLVMAGQYWRLLSSCFIHIGFIHLIFNLYALLYIGLQLEPLIGKLKMALAFAITGIGGATLSFWWNDNVVSAGASGAIFGLFGVYIALLTSKIIEKKTRRATLASLLVFVGFNLAYGMSQGIDNAAHIGGLLSGLLFGYSLLPGFYTPAKKWTNLGVNAFAVIWILFLTFQVLTRIPDDLKKYSKLMTEFAEVEEEGLSFYRLNPYSSNAEYLKVLREKGLPGMEKCRDIVLQIDSLKELSPEIEERIVYLKRYCDYRIDNYMLIEKALEGNRSFYEAQIQNYNLAIEHLIRKLQGEPISEDLLFVKPVANGELLTTEGVLYVLDGVPLDGVADIDPNIIEKISVLKEDVARSLYGNRAKNGAILISTKK